MMKALKYIFAGILFGILLFKTEMISWYRWQELFMFKSFHLFGVMFCAVASGALGLYFIKRFNIKDMYGCAIEIPGKKKSFSRYAFGGFIFGLGWAIAGCPGAAYTLIGSGYTVMIPVLLAAVAGTFLYGLIRKQLPH
jgi:uncharacterized protein